MGKLDKKSTSTKTDYEKKFDEEVGVELSDSPFATHFKFIKLLHDGNKSGRFQDKEKIRAEIVKFYSKYTSKEVAGTQGTIMTIGQLIGAWINAVENENKIKFKGTESFEQYNTLAQFIYDTLTVELLSRAASGESWNKPKTKGKIDFDLERWKKSRSKQKKTGLYATNETTRDILLREDEDYLKRGSRQEILTDWDNFYYTYLFRYEGYFVYAFIFIIIIFWIVLFALFMM